MALDEKPSHLKATKCYLPHAITHPIQVNVPCLNPSQAGQYLIHLVPTLQGWKAKFTWMVG